MKEVHPNDYRLADENIEEISNPDPIMDALLKIQEYASGGADSLTAWAGDDLALACLDRIKELVDKVRC